MSITDKPGDPADRVADGAFGGVHSHRAGYGDDRLERLIAYLRLHPTATLASGERWMLVQHILLLRARIEGMSEGAKVYEDHYADARAEINRLRDQLYLADQSARSSSAEAARLGRILAALREPSDAVLVAAHKAYVKQPDPTTSAIRAAVAAAEQEVGP